MTEYTRGGFTIKQDTLSNGAIFYTVIDTGGVNSVIVEARDYYAATAIVDCLAENAAQ